MEPRASFPALLSVLPTFREPENERALSFWETKGKKNILKINRIPSSFATNYSCPKKLPSKLYLVLLYYLFRSVIPSTWFCRSTKQTAQPLSHSEHRILTYKAKESVAGGRGGRFLQVACIFSGLDKFSSIWRCPVAPLKSVTKSGKERRGWGSELETWDLDQALSNFFGNCRDMRSWAAEPQRQKAILAPTCQGQVWVPEDVQLAFCGLDPVFFQKISFCVCFFACFWFCLS